MQQTVLEREMVLISISWQKWSHICWQEDWFSTPYTTTDPYTTNVLYKHNNQRDK